MRANSNFIRRGHSVLISDVLFVSIGLGQQIPLCQKSPLFQQAIKNSFGKAYLPNISHIATSDTQKNVED